MARPERRWPWLVWAATHVRHPAPDPRLAASVAQDILSLRHAPDVPDWLLLLVPGLYRAAGNGLAAAAVEAEDEYVEIRQRANADLMKKLNNQ